MASVADRSLLAQLWAGVDWTPKFCLLNGHFRPQKPEDLQLTIELAG